jgi:SAM-dependent methyltransferase
MCLRDIQCAICPGPSDYRVLYREKYNLKDLNEVTYSARRSPDTNHYRIVRCNKCGLVYSTPILEPSEVENLYRASSFTYGSIIRDLQDTYGFHLAKIDKLVPDKGRLLEIGCGNGFFLEKAKELGYREVYGVEPSNEAVKEASPSIAPNILNEVFGSGYYPGSYFDVVCFFQTLDHIVNPNDFLADCRNYLKEQGVVLCITHNIDAPSAKILGEKCPMIDIEHIYLFNKKTLRQIFSRNGFEVIEVFDVANIFPIWYYLRMFPLPGSLKDGLIRLSRIIGIGKTRIRMKVGNIGIIARRR